MFPSNGVHVLYEVEAKSSTKNDSRVGVEEMIRSLRK